ncbi:ABC transporter permease [Raineyella sp. LH-20]|uniref:ABC transporter permease n=1 Tax=Raineyella sp. LH-20 TaxID=3081204 RepID=UPI002952B8DE|nr:ABC transporter permease [Raineyella sp. LH-20]WOP19355.1 ABC transporter permease [Raineyella sp. LH-20]
MSTTLSELASAPPAPIPSADGGPGGATGDRPARPAALSTRGRRRLGRLTPPRWLSLVAILAVWQIAGSTGVLPADVLASPATIAVTAWHLLVTGQLVDALRVSLGRVGLGLVAGLLAGTVFGLLTGLSRWGDALLDPPLQALRTLPHLGLVPLFILWFGIGEFPKVLLIALGVMFPIYLNLHSAVRGVDRALLEVAAVNGLGRWGTLREVVFPSVTAPMLVALRQALAISWLTLIVSEQVNANAGLGYMINNARDFLQTDVIVVGLVVYAALGLISDAIVRAAEHRILAWRAGTVLR